jgi:hypothetical protein
MSTGCVVSDVGFVAFAPSASVAAGTYSAVQEVTLSASESTNIRYTRDGTTPSCASGTLYTAAIAVRKSQTLTAIACYPQGVSSAVSSFTYLLTIFDARTENAVPTSSRVGSAAFPTQTTSVSLSNTTKLDVSNAVATSSAGQIVVGGSTKTLSSFTSGNLSAVDLSVPVAVGGREVSVARAVAISSGVSGTPITLRNSDFSSATALIPDGAAVLAGTGWDGTIVPPRTGSVGTGAFGGFRAAGSVVELGSATETLLFDRPVSVVISGRAERVAYKAAGGDVWVQIANQCGGTYDSPVAPVFPGECYIQGDTNTKVYTYHLTSFALFEQERSGSTAAVGGNGPVGGVGAVLGDINGDARVDIFDFNLLLAVWGAQKAGPFFSGADLSRDGAIDIIDFTLLLANWK